jgi:hypothetical protein
MQKGLGCRNSFLGVSFQHPKHQILQFLIIFLVNGKVDFTICVIFHNLLIAGALEQVFVGEYVVKSDAQSEDVALGMALLRKIEHFWGDVSRRSAQIFLSGAAQLGAEAPVDEHDVEAVVLPEHEVLGLDIPVDNAVLCQIRKHPEQIREQAVDLPVQELHAGHVGQHARREVLLDDVD